MEEPALAREVAELPGGQRLSALITQVNGDPEAIRTIASRWRETAVQINKNIRSLNTAVTDVDNAWQGASADAFNDYMHKYGRAGNNLHDTLWNFANHLENAAQTLETAASNVNAIGTDLINRTNTYRAHNPKADKKLLDEAITTMATAAATTAATHVSRADTDLTTALKNISTVIDEKPMFFSAIGAPGDDKFLPTTAHPLDWQRTPHPDPTTTLAATTTPSGSSGHNGGGTPSGGGIPSGGAPPVLPYVAGSGTGAGIVNAAQANLGKPYVWGANGPSAFDCSGLVFNALNRAGIRIDDTTAAGYQASGQPITLPPRAGDIVFFGNPPVHCGIYVGDGKMINAPHPGAVVRFDDVAGQQPITYRRFT